MEEDKQKAIEMWHALHDAIKKTVCIDGCKLPMGKHGMCDGKCENKTMASPSPS